MSALQVEAENREHFLLLCESLGMIQQSHLERINTLMMPMALNSTSEDTLLQCIMDPSHKSLAGGLKGDAVMKFIRRCIFRLQVQVMSTQCC